MARIQREELERLKREADLVGLVEGSGVKLRRHGADLLGLCPFHEDHEPSLVVSPAKGLWHCLGACQAGGSVIDWVMRREGVSFRHAVEILRGAPAASAKARALPPLLEPDVDDQALLQQVVGYYHETLKESPEAIAYLEKRGLAQVADIDRFQLGFANRTLGYHLPKKALKAGAEIRSRLQRLGILRPSGHEHFTGSLVVPVIDADEAVREMYGRKITEGLRAGTPLHLYLPGAHAGVWNEAALAESKEVILCEALLDALSFWCAGYRNVTASYGVSGFTAAHHEAFRRYGTERVLIAYDRDAAGESAAAALAEQLAADGIGCYRIQFPQGMDANAYALASTPAAESLGERIRHAVWLGGGRATPAAKSARPPDEPGADELSVGVSGTSHSTAKASTSSPLAASSPSVPSASPLPAAPTPPLPVEVGEHEVVLRAGERSYRVRGLEKNTSADALRINLLVRQGAALHVDTLDLYAAKQRTAYLKQAASELGAPEPALKTELGQVLLALETLQEERLRDALTPREQKPPELSEGEEAAALDLLRAPDLLEQVLGAFEAVGVVGEETNKLVGYLASVSRKLERPLAVIVQSSSAAGKTSLLDAVLGFVPEEERIEYSAMTGQSLFYMGGRDLRHKVLAVVEEEGAERASYALKLLQSEGTLSIASTGKDPHTGRLVTEEYRVEGPVAIMLTTTATDLDEELLNRALVLSVDEARAQTRRVHERQRARRTLEGLLARREGNALVRLHQNAQRLLRPLAVVNPYAPQLTFLDTCTRTRRDHEKYLTLMDAIALLHQYQREVKQAERGGERIDYIEVTREDIEVANRLAAAVLGRSLDELPPQTRRFLEALNEWAIEECSRETVEPETFRFTARSVREALATGATQTKIHLGRLVDLEYVLMHRVGPRYTYELLYRGQGMGGEAFLPGLIEVEALHEGGYDAKRSGLRVERSGSGRPPAGGRSGRGRGASSGTNSAPVSRIPSLAAKERLEKPSQGDERLESYVVATAPSGNGHHGPADA